MNIAYSFPYLKQSSVLLLGFFDGIHKGHLTLFHTAKQFQKKNPQYSITVCTFEHPPSNFIHNISAPTLYSLEERINCFEELGVDNVFFMPMTQEFFDMSAEDFIVQLNLNIPQIHLITGEEAKFGKDQKGGKEFLQILSTRFDGTFSFEALENKLVNNQKISSTHLRQLYKEGKIKELNSYLHTPIIIKGEVVHGNKQGRLIGFPTMNMHYNMNRIIPPYGVYHSFSIINNIKYHSLTYISDFRFETISHTPVVETWVSQFNQDVYGQSICVYLLGLQRPPIKVKTLEEVKQLLEQDKKTLEC